jgi:metal-sulfur cluster biosynthetic enzyme
MFIQIETTPDPATLRFLPGRAVLGEGELSVHDEREAAASPLARRLFGISGVTDVVLGGDFVAITQKAGDWTVLKPRVLQAIMDHFASGAPAVAEIAAGDGPAETIREALRQVIDPELGYNIVDLGLIYDVAVSDGGEVRIVMTTTTEGCPATSYLMEGSRDAAWGVPGIEAVEVELTYEPSWTPEMMSPEAKAHFGITDGGGW